MLHAAFSMLQEVRRREHQGRSALLRHIRWPEVKERMKETYKLILVFTFFMYYFVKNGFFEE